MSEQLISKERFAQTAVTRGLEQASNTEALKLLYDKYCRTGAPQYLSDILLYAERLCMKKAFERLSGISCFKRQDFEDYLQEMGCAVSRRLTEDYESGRCHPNVVALISDIYKNTTIDIVRHLISAKPGEREESLEQRNETEDGKPKEVVGEEDLQLGNDPEDAREQEALNRQLFRMYLDQMLAYSDEPQKVLGCCYARVLYQVERLFDPEEIEDAAAVKIAKDRKGGAADGKSWIAAIRAVQESHTATSVKWALGKMGARPILTLTDESELLLRRNYDPSLRWGAEMRGKMDKSCPYGEHQVWGSLIYTKVFTEKELSRWALSIHNSITDAVCRRIRETPALEELVMRRSSPFEKLLREKKGKGKEHASDER